MSVVDLFAGQGSEVGLSRSGNGYYLYQEFLPEEYVVFFLQQAGFAGGVTLRAIRGINVGYLLHYTDDADADFVKTGSWSTIASGIAYRGNYGRLTGAGNVTVTTPAGVTEIRAYRGTGSSGVAVVSLNGDKTLATGLKTAQTLVDEGKLASSALIANGGTLDPSWRCWDIYSSTSPTFATGLAAGSYVVRVEWSGYKNPSSSSLNLNIDYIAWNGPGVSVGTAGRAVLTDIMGLTSSVVECAGQPMPTGATHLTWVGNGHGYEAEVSITFEVDGAGVTPADGEFISGAEVVVRRTSTYTHPDVAPAVIANVVTTYTLTAAEGLTIHTAITWAVDGVNGLVRSPMWPLKDGVFDKGTTELSGVDYTLTGNAGATRGNNLSRMVWLWEPSGTLGGVLSVPVGATVAQAQIEDRAGGSINKIYFDYTKTAISFSAGQVWETEGNYRVMRFADANESLRKHNRAGVLVTAGAAAAGGALDATPAGQRFRILAENRRSEAGEAE